jgi:ABC-2 type transport system ATP-binding protein
VAVAIKTDNLTKAFSRSSPLGKFLSGSRTDPGTAVVDRVSLEIEQGKIFALLGPNGVGKTTLVRILSTLILPTSGSAYVNGYNVVTDAERVKSSIGLVNGEGQGFFVRLTCRENLRFFGALYGLRWITVEERIRELNEFLELEEFLGRRVDCCSTGMKQRLAIARSLLHDAEVIFMDEPTKSLDPLAARKLRACIHYLAKEKGRTIFLITHHVEEAEELSDGAGIMNQGRVMIVDPRSGDLDQVFAGVSLEAPNAYGQSDSLH